MDCLSPAKACKDNVVALRRRSSILMLAFFLSLLSLLFSVVSFQWKASTNSGRYTAQPAKREMRDTFGDDESQGADVPISSRSRLFEAAVVELKEFATLLDSSISEIDARAASVKREVLTSPLIPPSVVESTSAIWGLDDSGLRAAQSEASQRREVFEKDPQMQEKLRTAYVHALNKQRIEELSEHASESLAALQGAANKASYHIETDFVAPCRKERFGKPRQSAPQWRNGMERRELGKGQGGVADLGPGDADYRWQQDNKVSPHRPHRGHGVIDASTPQFPAGELVDPNDRLNPFVDPDEGMKRGADGGGVHREHVVPRQDYQRPAAGRGNGNKNSNEKPLGEYGGVVRPANYNSNNHIDYDNDFYQGVVNDVPGPTMAPLPDPLDAIDNPHEKSARRAAIVIEAFRHSWKGYAKSAWGCDEAKPRSRTCKNWAENDGPRNGFGLTILDAITTAHLMGLTEEVGAALEYIRKDLHFGRIDVDGSVFEANIRALGGLISMYELTGEEHYFLLEKAVEIADILLFAFNTTTGLPHSTVNFKTRRHFGSPWGGGNAILSEVGTVQLEFRTLSYHTGNPVYDMKATHLMNVIEAKSPADFLMPLYMSTKRLTWATDHISLGALGDSFYEYVIKQYVLTGNTEERYAKLSAKMMKGLSKLLFRSKPSGMLYVAEHRARSFYHKMDHLACFAGGMFAMLAKEMPDLTEKEEAHIMGLAGDITETCVKMYTMQVTGVSPEYVEFPAGADFVNDQGYYILRPETIESVFYMWRYTKDEKWREYGWKMFRAIDRFCRVPGGGYVGIREVNVPDPPQDNLMQSFWLAETLKYFYLLFADDDALDLNEWVFNTEAHPFRRRNRDPLDVWRAFEEAHGSVPWFPPPLQGVRATETAKMMAMRRSGEANLAVDMASDPFAGDSGEEGMPDDEGLPFDEQNGYRGVPRDRRTMKDFLVDEGRQFDFSNVRRNGRSLRH